jgi:predicted ArsR family transcriptional regulator
VLEEEVQIANATGLTDLAALSSLDDSTRRRLYALVVEAGPPVGRDEAAASIGISRSLAAYHLDKLVAHGLLEASFLRQGKRAGPGAGRPAKLYQRAPREFALCLPPRDYQLLSELLVRAADEDQSGALRRTLARVAFEFGDSLGKRSKQARPVEPDELKGVLSLRGYEPVEDEHGTLRLRNCPFETVASEYPEVVCGLNLGLINGVIKGLSCRHTRAVLEPAEGHCCVAIKLSEARAG